MAELQNHGGFASDNSGVRKSVSNHGNFKANLVEFLAK